jgi:hypothetical protein
MVKVGDICKCSTNTGYLYLVLEINGAEVTVGDVVDLRHSPTYKNHPSVQSKGHVSIFTPVTLTKLSRILWGLKPDEKL